MDPFVKIESIFFSYIPKGIQCPHRGAVYSYLWRHLAFPYDDDDREACNVFFVWEMLRPLLKGRLKDEKKDVDKHWNFSFVKLLRHSNVHYTGYSHL